MKILGLFSLMLMAMSCMAFAADGAAAAAPSVSVHPAVQAILMGALGGVIAGLTGYLSRSKGEKMNWLKFGVTLAVGAGIGTYCGWTGKDFMSVETTLKSSGYVMLAMKVLSAFIKNMPFDLGSIFDAFDHPADPQAPAAPEAPKQ